jgi:single-strand DNA-binding protein
MNSLNVTLIEGNLVRDPEYKTTGKGTPLCTFSIAHNRFYKTGENGENTEKEVSFLDVEAWAKVAELCRDAASKGTGVRVSGRLRQDRWNDADGKAHSRLIIVAERVEFRTKARQGQESEIAPDNGESPGEADSQHYEP